MHMHLVYRLLNQTCLWTKWLINTLLERKWYVSMGGGIYCTNKMYLTLSSSRLNSPYSLRVPFPLVSIPQPDIIVVPDLMLVIVAGKSKAFGLCVVIPTSMLPDHFSTSLSIRICSAHNKQVCLLLFFLYKFIFKFDFHSSVSSCIKLITVYYIVILDFP